MITAGKNSQLVSQRIEPSWSYKDIGINTPTLLLERFENHGMQDLQELFCLPKVKTHKQEVWKITSQNG